jgi:hypothetical protein
MDANIYLANTFYFVEGLGEAPLWESVAALSHDGRPPLYQLLSVPFLYLFGRSADAALLINVVFGVVLLLSTYGIGRLVQDGKAGLLAALLVVAYPPLVDLSRIYRPHFAIAACVALSLWLLLLLLKARSPKIAWLFGASLVLGMLVHSSFLYVLAAPTVLFGFYALLFQTPPRYPSILKEAPRWLLAKLRDPFVLYGLLPAALVAAALTAGWYLTEGRTLLRVLQQVTQEGRDVTRGFSVPFSFWWYALTAPGAISYVFAIFFLGGLVAGIVKRQLYTFVLVMTFLAAYVVYSTRGGRAWFYLASVLPIVAILTATWIMGLARRRISAVLTIVCVGTAVLTFSVVTWGLKSWGEPFIRALGAPLNSQTCVSPSNVVFCPWPARDEDWRLSDVLEIIHDDADCRDRTCHLTLVQGWWNIWHVNYNSFRCYLARDFPETRLEIYSTRLETLADQLQLLLSSEYVLYRPDNYTHNLRYFLLSPPSAFADAHRQVASFEFPNGTIARLIKRVAPLTFEEVAMSVTALDFSQEDVVSFQRRLDGNERTHASTVAGALSQEDKASLKQWLDDYRQHPASEIKELLDDGAVEQALALSAQTLSMLTDKKKAALAAGIGNQLLNMGETDRAIELLNQVAPGTGRGRRVDHFGQGVQAR